MDKQKGSIRKKESQTPEVVERTKLNKTFIPDADILETNDDIVLVADMPGVDEKSVDITLENNILDINGAVQADNQDGHSLAYREYETGDYHRSFSITDEIDRDNIKATVNNGVLRLTLPKARPVTKKIEVKAA